jgi:cysteate synthase
MKLLVSQNLPFTPIRDAWNEDSRDMLPMDDDEARMKVEQINAKVLSNRKPPYGIAGGLYDAMKDAGGKVLVASNEDAEDAAGIFLDLEGIDVHPAAAIATASLINAVQDNEVEKDATVMLNITGGGEQKFKEENDIHFLEPSIVFDIDPGEDEVEKALNELFNL